ncbi:uncharacterized protein LOC131011296 isoform X4 [Salvia miltiorrhiza]|uniref:uncharacterized protein LOC131011296 isoform X4 n=1 Tax=Salvia miltiorrhiza TaxID=226208 RepID=UPI0025ABFAF1|nr:uncharacterized protein LOC131011296 isoform X4 [Salvia miltiorrhiza]
MRFKLSFPGGSFETWSENLALASFGGMIPFQNSSSLTTSPAAILLLASLLSILFRNPKNSHHLHNGVVQQYIQQIKHLESEQTSSISKANWVLKEQRSWRQVRDFFGWMKLQVLLLYMDLLSGVDMDRVSFVRCCMGRLVYGSFF